MSIELDSSFQSLMAAYQQQIDDVEPLTHGDSVEHLEAYRGILRFLAEKGGRRRNYRHYATRGRIESIVSGGAIFLSDGSGWNDKYDRVHFNPPFSGTKRFGACLSATTSESIAMWMLYGGIDGNGAMINFDAKTLKNAMRRSDYECGYFDEGGRFVCTQTLGADKIIFQLVDVLYFSKKQSGSESVLIGRSSKDAQVELSASAFQGLQQVAKHRSWAYEAEVRFVASVNRLYLGGRESKITCMKIPLELSADFVATHVFDSPVSDGCGHYLDSELLGTVDWDLCHGCQHRQSAGV